MKKVFFIVISAVLFISLITAVIVISHNSKAKSSVQNEKTEQNDIISTQTTEKEEDEEIIAQGGGDSTQQEERSQEVVLASETDGGKVYPKVETTFSEDGNEAYIQGEQNFQLEQLNGLPNIMNYSCTIKGINELKPFINDVNINEIQYHVYYHCVYNDIPKLPYEIEFFNVTEDKEFNSIHAQGRMYFEESDYIPILLTYKDGFYNVYDFDEEPHDNE